jgi:hypothetical protein
MQSSRTETQASITQPSKTDLARESMPANVGSPLSSPCLGVAASAALFLVAARLIVKGRQDLEPKVKKPSPEQITEELY